MYLHVHTQHSVVSDTNVLKRVELLESRCLNIVMRHYNLLSTEKEMTAHSIVFS